MKQIRSKQKRLIISCAKYFALYTLIIVLLTVERCVLVNFKVGSSFFTIDDLLLYKDALDYEEYAKIPAKIRKIPHLLFLMPPAALYMPAIGQSMKVFFTKTWKCSAIIIPAVFSMYLKIRLLTVLSTYSVFLSVYGSDDTVPKLLIHAFWMNSTISYPEHYFRIKSS